MGLRGRVVYLRNSVENRRGSQADIVKIHVYLFSVALGEVKNVFHASDDNTRGWELPTLSTEHRPVVCYSQESGKVGSEQGTRRTLPSPNMSYYHEEHVIVHRRTNIRESS